MKQSKKPWQDKFERKARAAERKEYHTKKENQTYKYIDGNDSVELKQNRRNAIYQQL